jgi:hypothetical protein
MLSANFHGLVACRLSLYGFCLFSLFDGIKQNDFFD